MTFDSELVVKVRQLERELETERSTRLDAQMGVRLLRAARDDLDVVARLRDERDELQATVDRQRRVADRLTADLQYHKNHEDEDLEVRTAGGWVYVDDYADDIRAAERLRDERVSRQHLEDKIDKILELARDCARLAPVDGWNSTPAEIAVADTGREILRILDGDDNDS